MKKKLLTAVLVVVVLISWSVLVEAAKGDVSFYGGLSYNTYDFEYHNQIVDEREGVNEINSGGSRFFGIRGWLTDDFALGFEMEKFDVAADRLYVDSSKHRDQVRYEYCGDFSADTVGRLLTFACQLSDADEPNILFILGAGNYKSDLNYEGKFKNYEEEKETVGVKTGLKANFHLDPNLMLSGRVMYRALDFDSELESEYDHEIINFTGLELGGGLTFKF